ncbi:carbonic anhydrase [Listeria monocytogenes]|nr:carbonic anhydrase [Listeria monocytogenes]EAC9919109.1 carbonic anhydrase [Listeria monocytogenes]
MTKEKVLWGYDEKTGPEMWGHICSDFEIAHTGKAQSPVDIEQADVVKLKPSTMKFYYKETDYTIRRIEQSVHVFPHDKEQGLRFNGEYYPLVSFHAHIPAEHLLDGYVYPIEWHFVHEKPDGTTLVMSAWMEIDNTNNVEFKDLPTYFPEVFADFETEREITLDVNEFMPEERVFYTYQGSRTTPPTMEGVTWIVLKNAKTLGQEDFTEFEKAIGNTSRPVQDLNGREITFYN